jgi:hypothetical protein
MLRDRSKQTAFSTRPLIRQFTFQIQTWPPSSVNTHTTPLFTFPLLPHIIYIIHNPLICCSKINLGRPKKKYTVHHLSPDSPIRVYILRFHSYPSSSSELKSADGETNVTSPYCVPSCTTCKKTHKNQEVLCNKKLSIITYSCLLKEYNISCTAVSNCSFIEVMTTVLLLKVLDYRRNKHGWRGGIWRII